MVVVVVVVMSWFLRHTHKKASTRASTSGAIVTHAWPWWRSRAACTASHKAATAAAVVASIRAPCRSLSLPLLLTTHSAPRATSVRKTSVVLPAVRRDASRASAKSWPRRVASRTRFSRRDDGPPSVEARGGWGCSCCCCCCCCCCCMSQGGGLSEDGLERSSKGALGGRLEVEGGGVGGRREMQLP